MASFTGSTQGSRGTQSTKTSSAVVTTGVGDDDALAYLKGILKNYGLEKLSDWAWKELQKGRSIEEVLISMYDQPTFKTRFPAIEARRNLGLAPISPGEYVTYEKELHQLFKTTGLAGFYTTKASTAPGSKPGMSITVDATFQKLVGNLLANDVSMDEVATRVQKGYQKVAQADPLVRAEFQRLFGVEGDAALAAYFLNPKESAVILEEKAANASIAGAARNFGFMLGVSSLDKVRDRGIDYEAAIQSFSELATMKPLFAETVGEGNRIDRRRDQVAHLGLEQQIVSAMQNPHEDLSAEDEGLDYAFGIDGKGRAAIEERRRSRSAAFGGGAVAQTRTGFALGAGDTDA